MKYALALSGSLFLVLVGCGGGASGLMTPTTRTCAPPTYALALSSPANGSTGVPTRGESLVFTITNVPSGFGALPAQLSPVSIATAVGPQISSGTLVANSSSTYVASLPTLVSATTYTVTQAVTPSTLGCPTSITLGSFTTQ